jgi:hypothetical protein
VSSTLLVAKCRSGAPPWSSPSDSARDCFRQREAKQIDDATKQRLIVRLEDSFRSADEFTLEYGAREPHCVAASHWLPCSDVRAQAAPEVLKMVPRWSRITANSS